MIAPVTFQWTVPAGLPAAGTVRNCFILVPPSPRADRRAVFYQWAAYAGNGNWAIPEPTDATSQLLCQLGLYVVGIDQGITIGSNGTYGAYRSEVPVWWSYVKSTYGCGPKLSALLRSRGGFWGNLAADIPGFFDRILGLGNITDGVSYDPIGIAETYTGSTSDPPAQVNFNAVPSVACPTLPTPAGNSKSLLQQNALNFLAAPLVASSVPMLFAYGTADTAVIPSGNALAFASNYAAAGGTHLKLLPVVGATHADITTTAYTQIINFMVADNPEQTMTLPLYSKGSLQVPQSVPVGVITQMKMEPFDDPNGMINSSNQMVIPVGGGGLWQFRACAQFSGPFIASTDFWVAIRLNGSIMKIQQTTSGAVAPTHGVDAIPALTTFPCVDGAVIDGAVYIFSGTGPYPLTPNSYTTSLEAIRIG